MRFRYLVGFEVAVCAAAGCTTLLGDFSMGPGEGTDASVSAEAQAEGATGAEGAADARGDAGGLDSAADALTDAADASEDGDAAACTTGLACVPAVCVTGVTACSASGTTTCSVVGPALPGTSCEGGVCFDSGCVPCNAGANCADAGSCVEMSIMCTTGAPVCSAGGNTPNGTPCGTNLYCDNGTCAACTNDASCAPTGAPCHVGSVTCADGGIICTDQGTLQMNGYSCGMNQVCDNGACNACTAGGTCNPGGNVCQTGMNSCMTGTLTCAMPVDVTTGMPCGGANQACNAGACVTIAPPQPIAPLSTALVTSQQPTFRWALATGTTAAQVDICSTRACTTVLQTITGAAGATTGTPATALNKGTYFWRLHGIVGATVGTTTSFVWEVRVGARSAPVNTSWGTVVDPNGDGLADLAVGAPGANGSAGAAYVYFSTGAGGLSATANPLISSGGTFGYAVSSAGDVNGDGFADVVVGARDLNGGAGSAFVYFGSSAGISASPNVTIPGPGTSNAAFGGAAASAGDVNRDGYADIIVGAYGAGGNAGAAYLYLGGPNGTSTTPVAPAISGPAANSYLGLSVASAGDVNGDGYGDVIIGATGVSANGSAYIYLGGPGGLVTTSPTVIAGPASNFGYSVWGADDVNGDGYGDVVVGAMEANSAAGAAYVYLGGSGGVGTTAMPALLGPGGANGFFGCAVSGAGDVNGDGYADLVVGAFEVTTGDGAAYVYFGGGSGLSITPTPITNPNPVAGGGGFFGFAVAGPGDINGDGYADVAIGADENGGGIGSAYIFNGKLGGVSTSASTTLTGTAGTSGNFGKPLE